MPERRIHPDHRLGLRLAVGFAAFAVLALGWRLTWAQPSSPEASVAIAGATADAATDAPADYVPLDSDPIDNPERTPDPLTRVRPLLAAPLDNLRVTSSFGMRRHPILGFSRMHQGVDFGAAEGSPVLAAADGLIEAAHPDGGYGNLILIRHAHGYETAYAHLLAYASTTRPGAWVTQGQVIGFVGHTGLATGPHLHFEIRLNGERIDPMTANLPRAEPMPPPSPAIAAALSAVGAPRLPAEPRAAGLRLAMAG